MSTEAPIDDFEAELAEERPSRRPWLFVGIVGCAVLLAGAACVAGALGFGYWGTRVFAQQVRTALEDNPVLREHIGEIRRFEVSFLETEEWSDPDYFAFEVEGSKGEGTVFAKCISIDADTEEVTEGTLRLATGERYDLFP